MRFLVLHAWIGWGHKKAALSLEEHLKQQGIDCELWDLLDFLPSPLRKFYPFAYSFLTCRLPSVWRFFYELNDRPAAPYAPARSVWQSWQFNKLRDRLRSCDFTHVIVTHYTAGALMLDWREMFGWKQRVYTVITDYVAHRCWKRLGFDQYFVPGDGVVGELQAAGVPRERITVSGIPVSTAFCRPVSRESATEKWRVKPPETAILVMTSGLKDGDAVSLMRELASLNLPARFLVSAGEEGKRLAALHEASAGDVRFTVFGFSNEIPEMMQACNLVVSKPGGLIVSESLASNLPMVLFSPIPGQEEGNAKYVTGEGAAVVVGPGGFRETLQQLLSDASRLDAMSKAARRIGKPLASQTIIETILRGSAVSPA